MSGMEQAPEIPQDVIRDVWATNVTGVINMTQAILPIFKAREDGGRGDVIMLTLGSRCGFVARRLWGRRTTLDLQHPTRHHP